MESPLYGSIDHSRIIEAFTRNVPDCYVRDYLGKGGELAICRGYKTVIDGTNGHEWVVPRHQLCVIPRGSVQAPSLAHGAKTVRPGWRVEMKKAGKYLTSSQMDRIERDLKVRVFQR